MGPTEKKEGNNQRKNGSISRTRYSVGDKSHTTSSIFRATLNTAKTQRAHQGLLERERAQKGAGAKRMSLGRMELFAWRNNCKTRVEEVATRA